MLYSFYKLKYIQMFSNLNQEFFNKIYNKSQQKSPRISEVDGPRVSLITVGLILQFKFLQCIQICF